MKMALANLSVQLATSIVLAILVASCCGFVAHHHPMTSLLQRNRQHYKDLQRQQQPPSQQQQQQQCQQPHPQSPLFALGRGIGSGNNNKNSPAAPFDPNSDTAPPLKRNPPRRICLMVEPTPFTHVSGYANRFKEMLKFLQKAGDTVSILTVDSKTPAKQLPSKFMGFRIRHTQGFTFPLYNHISLSLDLPEMKGAQIIDKLKPDLIHVTSP
jgi:hypothetical protein